jgi:hypothetical protein
MGLPLTDADRTQRMKEYTMRNGSARQKGSGKTVSDGWEQLFDRWVSDGWEPLYERREEHGDRPSLGNRGGVFYDIGRDQLLKQYPERRGRPAPRGEAGWAEPLGLAR